jgi:trigger factor
MKIELNKIDDLNAELSIQINAEDYTPRIEKKLKEYRKNAQVPGFRKGMVPMGHIQRLYGKSLKASEINELVHESLVEYMKTDAVSILGDPLINFEKTDKIDNWDSVNEINFVFDLGIRPEVEIKLTKKHKIPYYKIEVKKDHVDETIQNLAQRYGTIEDVDAVAETDMIVGDIRQLDPDGNLLEGGIVAETAFIRIASIVDAKTKKKFVGKKKEDKVVFNPKTAMQNATEIAGLLRIEKTEAELLDCNFEITINQVRRLLPVEVNADLFEKVYPGQEITTEELFRARLIEDLEKSNSIAHQNKFMETARKYMIEKFNPKLPEEFLKRWMVDNDKSMTPEKIEEVWDDYRKTFQWQLIVDKIAKENELKIDEADIIEKAKDEVRLAFSYYNMTNIPEETLTNLAKSKLEKDGQYHRYASMAIEDKVLEKIREMANVEEIAISAEKFHEQ